MMVPENWLNTIAELSIKYLVSSIKYLVLCVGIDIGYQHATCYVNFHYTPIKKIRQKTKTPLFKRFF